MESVANYCYDIDGDHAGDMFADGYSAASGDLYDLVCQGQRRPPVGTIDPLPNVPSDEQMSAWIYPIAPGDELTAVDRQMLVASGEEHGVKVYDQAPAPAKDGGDQRWLTPEIRMEKVHTHLEGICVPETRCISNHERRKTSRARRSSRYSETHNLTEKRRRCRINEKLKTLQQLVPGCDKSNQASTLDKTIRYMKSLQQHLQAMSVRCSTKPAVSHPFVQPPPYIWPAASAAAADARAPARMVIPGPSPSQLIHQYPAAMMMPSPSPFMIYPSSSWSNSSMSERMKD